jgi:hypothetical protein
MPQDALEELLNSSNQEYQLAAKSHFRAGLKSIESMHSSRIEDRFSSKKRLRTLEDSLSCSNYVGRGAVLDKVASNLFR